MNYMIAVTKQERDYLEKNGCVWEEDLHRSHSKHKKYYATENKKVKALLWKYENEIKSKKSIG